MTFWDFVHQHPIVSLIGLFLLLMALEGMVANIANACRRGR